MNQTENLGNIFRAVRKFHGLGQTEFAATLGITQGTVSKIEAALMGPDLALWFRFLDTFGVLDPYCFTYGGIEFKKEKYSDLLADGMKLLPNYKLDAKTQYFSVKKIKPLVTHLERSHEKMFNNFLKKSGVKIELFTILNHPLPILFMSDFFEFLDSVNISEKALSMLKLDFYSSFGKRAEQSVDDVLSDDQLFQYEFNKNEYVVTVNPSNLKGLMEVKKGDAIVNYNLLYPFYLLRSSDKVPSVHPKIVKMQTKEEKWKISYAS